MFDHFILNLALWGGLILTFNDDTRYLGALVVLVLAAVTIFHGFRERHEPFLIYAYIYAVIAIDVVVVQVTNEPLFGFFFLVISTIAAIAGLFLLHFRFRSMAS